MWDLDWKNTLINKWSWFNLVSVYGPNINGEITAQMISSQWTGECRQWIMLKHCAYNLGGKHPAWSPKVAIYCFPTENVWGLRLLTFIPAASHFTADLCRRSAECFKFTIPNENGRKLYFFLPSSPKARQINIIKTWNKTSECILHNYKLRTRSASRAFRCPTSKPTKITFTSSQSKCCSRANFVVLCSCYSWHDLLWCSGNRWWFW